MPRKRGEGTSCHHCKKRTQMNNMIRCVNDGAYKGIGRKRKRPCVKKYCLHCIKTFYDPQYLIDNDNSNFICPSCKDECRCAACRRRTMKAKLHADGTKLRAVQPNAIVNPILESKAGPDATKIEEEQVNSLLEILESRPDVQDIIRKGMSLDFADENAKILYIAHLIDQALSRPDILALYYAHTTGKSTLKSTKIEEESVDDSMGEDDNGNQNEQLLMNNNGIPPNIMGVMPFPMGQMGLMPMPFPPMIQNNNNNNNNNNNSNQQPTLAGNDNGSNNNEQPTLSGQINMNDNNLQMFPQMNMNVPYNNNNEEPKEDVEMTDNRNHNNITLKSEIKT